MVPVNFLTVYHSFWWLL